MKKFEDSDFIIMFMVVSNVALTILMMIMLAVHMFNVGNPMVR